MDRTAFHYLFIHAHALAELALLRNLSRMEADLDAAIAQEVPLNEAEQEALLQAQMDKLRQEMEAPDYVSPFEATEEQTDYTPLPLPTNPPLGWADEDTDGTDLAAYLAKAYAPSEEVAERAERTFSVIDMPALERALAALPANLPSLGAPLDAGALEQWLKLEEQGNAALTEVVTSIRAADMD